MKNLNFVSRTDKSQQLFLPFLFDIHFFRRPFRLEFGWIASKPRNIRVFNTSDTNYK